MMNRATLNVSVDLAAADAAKVLVAAPGAKKAVRVFKIIATCDTSAAQKISIADGGFARLLMKIPASSAVPHVLESQEGILLAENQTLLAAPAAAGPAWNFYVEYTIDNLV